LKAGPAIAVVSMGAESPFGTGLHAAWSGLLNEVVTPTRIARFDLGEGVIANAIQSPHIVGSKRVLQMARSCAREAMGTADEVCPNWVSGRIGLYLATAHGEEEPVRLYSDALAYGDGTDRNLTAEQRSGLKTENLIHELASELALADAYQITVSAACASANLAISFAYMDLKSSFVDAAIVVCVDALCRASQAGFSLIGALASESIRPFCLDRTGTVISEGAAAFILVAEHIASATTEHVLIEGFGVSSDAFHQIHPDPSGLGIESAITLALRSAQLRSEEIDAIFVHGSGTRQNDAAESAAISRCFPRRTLFGCGTKAALGHTMGAAGAFGLLAAVRSLQTQVLPPTPGCLPVDESCPLDLHQTSGGRLITMRHLLNNAYGFGGINCVLAIGRGAQ
jgi:3-oxoacyl-(acyl-carrier-protein) synthase